MYAILTYIEGFHINGNLGGTEKQGLIFSDNIDDKALNSSAMNFIINRRTRKKN